MEVKVSIQQKKDFVRWFLNHYQFKKRECVWILNYMMSHDSLMRKLHFVETVEKCHRGLMMSTHCVNEKPFRFYKSGAAQTTDPEKAFHDIRLNRDEDIYIQLKFDAAATNKQYAEVLEHNPYCPDDYIEDDEFEELADRILNASLRQFSLKQLMDRIDEALDNGDEKIFMELSDKYNQTIKFH